MSARTLKAGVQTLLQNAINAQTIAAGNPKADNVLTGYPRGMANTRQPQFVLWVLSERENRTAAGRGGTVAPWGQKERVYRLLTHIVWFQQDPGTETGMIDDLLEQVLTVYRGTLDLGGLADVAGVSQIQNFGDNLTVDTPQPENEGQFLTVNSYIFCEVTEVLDA